MPRIMLVGVLVLTGLLVLFAVAVPFIVSENRERTGHHVVEYSVRISSDTSLDNLTLLLPLASVSGSSRPGEDLVSGSGYGVPPGWNMTLEWYNGSPMLKLTDVQFVPERVPYPVPIDEDDGGNETRLQESVTVQPIARAATVIVQDTLQGSTFRVRIEPESGGATAVRESPVLRPVEFGVREMIVAMIDTRDPFGAEPLLEPKEDLHETGCSNPGTKTTRCFAYTSPVYISYRSDGPADLVISVSVHGSNEWWELGWSSNSYTDRVIASPFEGQEGWVTAEGVLITGNGRY